MLKHIFKLEDVKPGVPKVYQFPKGSKVTINGFQLKKDRTAEVEVAKLKDLPNTIFITLYSKFTEIGTVVSQESYVIDLEVIDSMKHYELRPLKESDIK
ncbi:hypothetical protein KM792_13110 [Clostridium tyrobutyricum]|uniref:hypothetical protein n=1 Tax=Clostridium tyrobutyricum TaxID=1519 RepID=UPI001C384ACD|nr:hypothetical protein [Clostridium tyrobutyricum]MBV4427119.1 hypothetical protein [Clostridium tyrobutyricum]MBV4442154.1 hypothetical protein [Clostridium tyrobutyricum]MBV4442275.1 hypothetical protein [Clostridium tyrobutyricum]MBV4450584.1 hypothetical protein [Clostridium tyrobutyricum]